ncbi:MAG: hypothetical protein CM15mP129_04320 [Chloroflexota bacterium]|nr:MAG: hypothetical protein CM15mP129_04320 [Chloroflexota bacterium]
MKRVGFVFKIKKESIDEYKEHHKKVWPEMLEALKSMAGEIILYF